MTGIKLFLLLLSNIGFWEFLRRKVSINTYFIPSLTIAVQATLLFAAGLLNFLYEAAVLIYVCGIISFVYYLLKEKIRFLIDQYLSIGFIFLFACSAVMLIFVRGRQFGHIDNFTHWALVVKDMLKFNRFPNFSDKVIGFQAYPLGSSLYIYYFSRMAGVSEPIQMFAQIYMMLTCILPLFVFCRKNQVYAFIIITAAANFFFVYNVKITNLLVDTLLPLAGMCSFLYVYLYGRSVDPKNNFYSAAFYMIWVIQIKNSGILFVICMVLYILWNGKKDGMLRQRIVCIAAPFLSWFLWHKHFLYAFDNAEHSNNAFTIANLFDVFASKSQEDIRFIINNLLKFTVTWNDIRMTALLILIGGILVFFVKAERRSYFAAAIFSFILFVIYQTGLLGTYFFSMKYFNNNGALPEIRRYDKTILIAVIYLLIVMIIKTVSHINSKPVLGLASAFLIIAYFCGFMIISLGEIRTAVQYYDDMPWDINQRLWLEKQKKEFVMEEDDTYCILTRTAHQANYLEHVGHYEFFTENVRTAVITDPEMMDGITEEFIFIYDSKNEFIREWVETHYPEQAGNQVIRRWDLYETN